MDQFLYAKFAKKVAYWSSIKLPLACRVVICNHVVLSIPWFFLIFIINIWGPIKISMKIKGAICNYLWLGKEQLTRTRVTWREYRMQKKHGELGLLDLR